MNQKSSTYEKCDITIIHEDIVNKVKDKMPEEETLNDLADFFKVFSDSTRTKILSALFESEMCVCDIAAVLGMNQPAVSQQLRVLKQSKLVRCRKDGKIAYYSLENEHIKQIFDHGLEQMNNK